MKYSTRWEPPIGVCRSEMGLLRPKYTKLDLDFCKKVMSTCVQSQGFFGGHLSHLFVGQGDLFSEASTFYRNCGVFTRIVECGGNCNEFIGFIYMQWSITIKMILLLIWVDENSVLSLGSLFWRVGATMISIDITTLRVVSLKLIFLSSRKSNQ